MENPSKFTVLSSSKGNNVPDSHDRLGGLPEHVVHHIISFLGANDIARLSFASKGCRQICISSPYLYFDVDFASHECATKCSQFKEFLSKFLRSRNGQLIQLLRFRWLCDSCECSNERPYDSWICDALGCNVKELDIGYRIDEQNRLALPISANWLCFLEVARTEFAGLLHKFHLASNIGFSRGLIAEIITSLWGIYWRLGSLPAAHHSKG
ncbi:hypothetical protein OIU85_007966 [Salix viminalis]|uniref:F-box domain-containing protein n=1 Tax=Salix viminalis TaxID=40686 RepID=A0A9Q0SPA3_SALVM|nr:hypothetical protein OIU85_007966 [Salix viminalis]